MTSRKKKTPKSVPCPAHGSELKVQSEGNRFFAVCNCEVPNNKHLGKVVWEWIPKETK